MTANRWTNHLLLLASVAALAALFLLVFDRFTYYDYHSAQCAAGDARLIARLTGSYDPSRPRTRAAPYRLTIEASGIDDRHSVSNVSVQMDSPGATQLTPSLERIERGEHDDSAVAFRLLSPPLKLEYEDQLLVGTVRSDYSDRPPVSFKCAIRRNFHREWRWPWFDAWMSI